MDNINLLNRLSQGQYMKINELNTVNDSLVNSICETITDDPHINHSIEHGLKKIPEDQRIPVLDALEILYMNQEPIILQAWADKLSDLHQNIDLGATLKLAVTTFPWLIARVAPRTYDWVENLNQIPNDPAAQQGTSAVNLAKIVLDSMKALNSWTKDELAAWITQQTGIPQQAIMPYISHVLGVFPSKIQQDGDRYTWTQTEKSGMDVIKNLVNRNNNNENK